MHILDSFPLLIRHWFERLVTGQTLLFFLRNWQYNSKKEGAFNHICFALIGSGNLCLSPSKASILDQEGTEEQIQYARFCSYRGMVAINRVSSIINFKVCKDTLRDGEVLAICSILEL